MQISIGVLFELRQADTQLGEILRVVGAGPEMGDWQVGTDTGDGGGDVRSLWTNSSLYPCWTMRKPVWFNICVVAADAASVSVQDRQTELEYKFIRDRRSLGKDCIGEPILWETGIPNRRTALPMEDGSIWIVTHACWNSGQDQAEVTRLTPKGVRMNWQSLDPERAGVALQTAHCRARWDPRKALPDAEELQGSRPPLLVPSTAPAPEEPSQPSPQSTAKALADQPWPFADELACLKSYLLREAGKRACENRIRPTVKQRPPSRQPLLARVEEEEEEDEEECASSCNSPLAGAAVTRQPKQPRSKTGLLQEAGKMVPEKEAGQTVEELQSLLDQSELLPGLISEAARAGRGVEAACCRSAADPPREAEKVEERVSGSNSPLADAAVTEQPKQLQGKGDTLPEAGKTVPERADAEVTKQPKQLQGKGGPLLEAGQTAAQLRTPSPGLRGMAAAACQWAEAVCRQNAALNEMLRQRREEEKLVLMRKKLRPTGVSLAIRTEMCTGGARFSGHQGTLS